MKFEEYISQEQPVRQAVGSVNVSEIFITFHKPVIRIHSQLYLMAVSIGNWSYVIKSNDDTLWTMDEDGNPKARSVFSHKINPKKWKQ